MLTNDEEAEIEALGRRKFAYLFPQKRQRLTPEEATRLEELEAKCPIMQRRKRELEEYIAYARKKPGR
jgi:hypothetical protein